MRFQRKDDGLFLITEKVIRLKRGGRNSSCLELGNQNSCLEDCIASIRVDQKRCV